MWSPSRKYEKPLFNLSETSTIFSKTLCRNVYDGRKGAAEFNGLEFVTSWGREGSETNSDSERGRQAQIGRVISTPRRQRCIKDGWYLSREAFSNSVLHCVHFQVWKLGLSFCPGNWIQAYTWGRRVTLTAPHATFWSLSHWANFVLPYFGSDSVVF